MGAGPCGASCWGPCSSEVITSETDSQKANSGPSTWNVVLSSSVVLAAITGVFYLLGGATVQGRAWALGLNYLAGLQPNDYLFAGVKLLLTDLSVIGFTGLVSVSALAIFGVHRLLVKHIERLQKGTLDFRSYYCASHDAMDVRYHSHTENRV